MSYYKETQSVNGVRRWFAASLVQGVNLTGADPVLKFSEVIRCSDNGVMLPNVPTQRLLELHHHPALRIPHINLSNYTPIVDENGNPREDQSYTSDEILYMLTCAYIWAATLADRREALVAPPITTP